MALCTHTFIAVFGCTLILRVSADCLNTPEVKKELVRNCYARELASKDAYAKRFSQALLQGRLSHKNPELGKRILFSGQGELKKNGFDKDAEQNEVDSIHGLPPSLRQAPDPLKSIGDMTAEELREWLPPRTTEQCQIQIEKETAVEKARINWSKVCDKWMFDNFRSATSWFLSLAGMSYFTGNDFAAEAFGILGVGCAAAQVTTQCLANPALRKAVCIGTGKAGRAFKTAGVAIAKSCVVAGEVCRTTSPIVPGPICHA